MTSLRWVKTSKFWENGFINKQFTSKYLLLLIFIILSTLNSNFNFFWPNFVLVTSSRGVKTSSFWNSGLINELLISSNFPLLLNFTFLPPLVRNASLGPFLPNFVLMMSLRKSKLQYFEKWSQKQTPLFKFWKSN